MFGIIIIIIDVFNRISLYSVIKTKLVLYTYNIFYRYDRFNSKNKTIIRDLCGYYIIIIQSAT